MPNLINNENACILFRSDMNLDSSNKNRGNYVKTIKTDEMFVHSIKIYSIYKYIYQVRKERSSVPPTKCVKHFEIWKIFSRSKFKNKVENSKIKLKM